MSLLSLRTSGVKNVDVGTLLQVRLNRKVSRAWILCLRQKTKALRKVQKWLNAQISFFLAIRVRGENKGNYALRDNHNKQGPFSESGART